MGPRGTEQPGTNAADWVELDPGFMAVIHLVSEDKEQWRQLAGVQLGLRGRKRR